jgi:PEP-CTERM putative exosortase interaction domain
MSANKSPRLVKKFLIACTAGLFAVASLSAKADLALGISFPSQGGGDNDVVGFDTSNPGTILFDHPIIGVVGGESIRGIDFWNGTVYALGSAGNLYNLNYNTGQATLIGSGLGVVLNGASYGVENDPTGVHIVSELGQNLTANRTTGAAAVGPAVNPAGTFLSALAYRSSTGTMFGIDSSANTLGTFNPATGTFSTIGLLAFDVARNNGFDIAPSGVAYLASGASSSDVQANLYTVNLATGMASLVGLIGQVGDNTLLRGLTIVPEPGTGALLVGGLALLALNIRRRK